MATHARPFALTLANRCYKGVKIMELFCRAFEGFEIAGVFCNRTSALQHQRSAYANCT
ncbi:hypothetical protein SBA1_120075 [Candidatus Sulfotelmatobacter kueseliae]|uniref:Uncharacterized protein n=1 Tax=Candidatus Sulfotelmatobacter kueseliae TaxID=2042962 RepID=A0A2U3K210_9BACT|nr:hypothetical protein SBA1_120075 [Candidatus Sulfotelmatobacter kueseliae]